jgi:hypothetical protein
MQTLAAAGTGIISGEIMRKCGSAVRGTQDGSVSLREHTIFGYRCYRFSKAKTL